MNSLLITGASSETRLLHAQRLAEKVSSVFDTIYIDTEVERGIASARNLRGAVSKKPFQSSATSIIIAEAQKLTPEAQTAILKTLEEPLEATQIILTAPSRDTFLPTIVSRCLEIQLKDEKRSEEKFKEDEENLDQLITQWAQILENKATAKENFPLTLQNIHRYNKILLRLKKAEKLSANKKLLSLIAHLEKPQH